MPYSVSIPVTLRNKYTTKIYLDIFTISALVFMSGFRKKI